MTSTSTEMAPPSTPAKSTLKRVSILILAVPLVALIGGGLATVLGEQATEKVRVKIARAGGKCETIRRVPAWLRGVVGDKFHSIFDQTAIIGVKMSGDNIGDAEASTVSAAKELERLTIEKCKATSACLEEIAKLKSLRSLTLSETQVTELAPLAKLPELLTLDLNFSAVRDANLGSIGQFPKLKRLNLRGLMITDSGVEEIAKCSTLEFVHLGGAQLGPTGLKPLQAVKSLDLVVLNDAQFDPEDLKELKKAIPGLR